MPPRALIRAVTAVVLVLGCAAPASAEPVPAPASAVVDVSTTAPVRASRAVVATGAPAAPYRASETPASRPGGAAQEEETGLRVTLDSVDPVTLSPGDPLELSGTVINDATTPWLDAQVYLDVTSTPATDRAGLQAFASTTGTFGQRVVTYGLFDEIGDVAPGQQVKYRLRLPYRRLPIDGTEGVYHVGVSVLAGNESGRDSTADAAIDVLVPLLADRPRRPLTPTDVVTLVPVAAAVRRDADGDFLDDDLASSVAYGGQLRNLVNFIDRAPEDSLQLVVDPALLTALTDMSDGYTVQSAADTGAGTPPHAGHGRTEARLWLETFTPAAARQDVLLMPWEVPDASTLGTSGLGGVAEAAVRATTRYASAQRITTSVAGWQFDGASSRRGLGLLRDAGAPLRIVSEASLPDLADQVDGAYPPSQVSVPTSEGPLTALVTRRDVGGEVLRRGTEVLTLRQALLAEATVRALDREPRGTSVIAVPFGWNPGDSAADVGLASAYTSPVLRPRTATSAAQDPAIRYTGAVRVPPGVRGLPDGVLEAARLLRRRGGTLAELLTAQDVARASFDQRLASAGSSLWRSDQRTHALVVRRESRRAAERTAKVTVIGPPFVTLSSGSGRFPLTVTNGLDAAVTVKIKVRPFNRAVRMDPIPELRLEPGQQRDVEVTTRSERSGLTRVYVRLSTTDDHVFGKPWQFNLRATRIGLAIWVVMGLGGFVLCVAAARRIYLRVRTGTLRPRAEQLPR